MSFLIGLLLAAPSIALASVSADLKVYDAHVAELKAAFAAKGPGDPHDKAWVKIKIQHMVDVDQYMRKYGEVVFDHRYTEAEKKDFNTQFISRWTEIDRSNTAELKKLLKIYPWFTISAFDRSVDENAWLLAQHADLDPAFQKEVLKILEPLFKAGETKPANYAYLFDRVAVAQKLPQRYGSQGHCTGPGLWEPDPCEDPSGLDARRKSVGLDPEATYRAVFKNICH
jgi:hypothetical protein